MSRFSAKENPKPRSITTHVPGDDGGACVPGRGLHDGAVRKERTQPATNLRPVEGVQSRETNFYLIKMRNVSGYAPRFCSTTPSFDFGCFRTEHSQKYTNPFGKKHTGIRYTDLCELTFLHAFTETQQDRSHTHCGQRRLNRVVEGSAKPDGGRKTRSALLLLQPERGAKLVPHSKRMDP